MEPGTLMILWIIFGFLFGLAGIAIAENKGASGAAGFWLGVILGPIGLIIVALLSPSTLPDPKPLDSRAAFTGQRDLENDAYKIWLTSHYDIKKNDVLSAYVCGDRLHSTVDAALTFASERYEKDIEAANAETLTLEREQAESLERLKQEMQKDANQFSRFLPLIIIGGIILWYGLLLV